MGERPAKWRDLGRGRGSGRISVDGFRRSRGRGSGGSPVVAETLSADLCGWRTGRPATGKRQSADGLGCGASVFFFFSIQAGVG
jgi:hypothetical protein